MTKLLVIAPSLREGEMWARSHGFRPTEIELFDGERVSGLRGWYRRPFVDKRGGYSRNAEFDQRFRQIIGSQHLTQWFHASPVRLWRLDGARWAEALTKLAEEGMRGLVRWSDDEQIRMDQLCLTCDRPGRVHYKTDVPNPGWMMSFCPSCAVTFLNEAEGSLGVQTP